MAGGLGDFISGAGGGALAGGSTGNPLLALGGGIVGGLAGYFGGNQDDAQNKKRMEDYYSETRTRGAPSVGHTATGNYSDFRNNQSNLIEHLEAMSQGRGPSLATEQFKATNDRNVAQQQAMALSGQGNATAAAMGAANNSAQLGAQSAQNAGQARIQEQQMALNQLGLTLHGARDMDEGMNRFNAGQTNQTSLANLDAQLRARGMDDATRLQILSQMNGQNNQPSVGDGILAGGAGMFSMGATNRAQNRGNQSGGRVPPGANFGSGPSGQGAY